MSPFPTTIAGSMLDTMDDLVRLLEKRGRTNHTDNPAQLSSAEGLIVDQRDPIKAAAIAEACARLIPSTDSAGVLMLCAHLGASQHPPFYEAVVQRLDHGPPIPDVPGAAEPTLVDELATTLASKDFGKWPNLHRRAVDNLVARGRYRVALHILSSADPNQIGPDILAEALRRGPIDSRLSTVVGLLVWRMAKNGSARLLDVAATLSTTPAELRALGAERAQQGNPAWWAKHGASFKAKAGLP